MAKQVEYSDKNLEYFVERGTTEQDSASNTNALIAQLILDVRRTKQEIHNLVEIFNKAQVQIGAQQG